MKRVTLRQQTEPAERAERAAPDGASHAAVRESIEERGPATPVSSRVQNGTTV
jgi:hypothetical protein